MHSLLKENNFSIHRTIPGDWHRNPDILVYLTDIIIITNGLAKMKSFRIGHARSGCDMWIA